MQKVQLLYLKVSLSFSFSTETTSLTVGVSHFSRVIVLFSFPRRRWKEQQAQFRFSYSRVIKRTRCKRFTASFTNMFSWGEDYRQSFRQKKGSNVPTSDRVHFLNLVILYNDRTDERKFHFALMCAKIRAVSCGDDVVTLLSDGGKVFCVDPSITPFTPRPPPALSSVIVTQIACGSHHTVALTKDDQVYTWGQDSRGQLGLGGSNSGAGSPQHIRSLSAVPVVRISAGGEHSFALTVSGGVFGWGRNDCGQLGLGDKEDRNTPVLVNYLNTKKVTHISCGQEHTVALTKDGAVFTFGSGQHGQLGHNSFQNELRPRLVAELWGAKVTKTACGRYHTLVLTDRMKAYSFGCNDHQQLGRDEESHPSVPLPQYLHPFMSTHNLFPHFEEYFFVLFCFQEGLNSKINITQQPIEKLVAQEIRRTFSSASIVNRSFLDQSKDKHFQTSSNYPGLDLSLAKSVFKNLPGSCFLLQQVEKAVLLLLPRLDNRPVGVEGLRVFLVLTELLHVTQKYLSLSLKLAEEITAAFQKLSPESLRIIGTVKRASNKIFLLSLFPQMGDNQPLLLCDFPFLMDLKSKKTVFDLNTACIQVNKHRHQTLIVIQMYSFTFPQKVSVEDVLIHLQNVSFPTRDRLNIVYILLMQAAERDQKNFHLFGILCGLALYNNSLIQLPFPLALFKKLLDIEPTLEDMMEFSEGVGGRLRYILDYEDDLEDLDITFEVGDNLSWLISNLFLPNRKEFVDAYVNYAFNTSVEGVFQEFKRGFFLVCDQQLVKLFRPEELQGVLAGGDVYNWVKLKQVHSAKWFSFLMNLLKNRKKILFWIFFFMSSSVFLTGSRKVPVLGMDQIRMKLRIKQIQSGSHDEHFPESLTCHSILELPLYSTKDIMRERLTEALEPQRGFRM
uniref:HECT domain-containing protein n=1 Tax=Poecilia mexicana TaxID=48701 RepID=A0A3B3Z1X6_9TELE